MRRATLSLLLFLGGLWSVSLGQRVPKFTTPRIVATFERFGVTGAISPTTIYTPKSWGTFRISIVLVGTVANGHQQSSYEGGILFTDGAGKNTPTASTVAILPTDVKRSGQVEFPIRAKPEKPIQLFVSANGHTSGTQYNVWVVVEQLM
jgi:hypothetical protein